MKTMENSYLLTLTDVKKLGGTYYIEIQKGFYDTIKSSMWKPDSMYIYGDIWINLFEKIVAPLTEDYDFYSFTTVNGNDTLIITEKFLAISEDLNKVNTFKEFEQLAVTLNIQFGNGLVESLINPNSTFLAQEDFGANFATKIMVLENTYQNCADWLIQHGQRGISILGI